MDTKDETIGGRVRIFRGALGLSGNAAAALMETDRTILWGWESGRHEPRRSSLLHAYRSLVGNLDVANPEDDTRRVVAWIYGEVRVVWSGRVPSWKKGSRVEQIRLLFPRDEDIARVVAPGDGPAREGAAAPAGGATPGAASVPATQVRAFLEQLATLSDVAEIRARLEAAIAFIPRWNHRHTAA